MQIFYIVSLIFFAIFFATKSVIHIILDSRHGYQIQYGSSRGFVYFLPYDKEVSAENLRLKKICNFLQKISIISLVTFLIAFFSRLILSR